VLFWLFVLVLLVGVFLVYVVVFVVYFVVWWFMVGDVGWGVLFLIVVGGLILVEGLVFFVYVNYLVFVV